VSDVNLTANAIEMVSSEPEAAHAAIEGVLRLMGVSHVYLSRDCVEFRLLVPRQWVNTLQIRFLPMLHECQITVEIKTVHGQKRWGDAIGQ
jgi:hypothetical protein